MKDREQWLKWAMELQSLSQAGLNYAKDVFDLAKQNDPLALIVIRHFSKYLGIACSHVANMLNPSFIVIGGGVSAAG